MDNTTATMAAGAPRARRGRGHGVFLGPSERHRMIRHVGQPANAIMVSVEPAGADDTLQREGVGLFWTLVLLIWSSFSPASWPFPEGARFQGVPHKVVCRKIQSRLDQGDIVDGNRAVQLPVDLVATGFPVFSHAQVHSGHMSMALNPGKGRIYVRLGPAAPLCWAVDWPLGCASCRRRFWRRSAGTAESAGASGAGPAPWRFQGGPRGLQRGAAGQLAASSQCQSTRHGWSIGEAAQQSCQDTRHVPVEAAMRVQERLARPEDRLAPSPPPSSRAPSPGRQRATGQAPAPHLPAPEPVAGTCRQGSGGRVRDPTARSSTRGGCLLGSPLAALCAGCLLGSPLTAPQQRSVQAVFRVGP